MFIILCLILRFNTLTFGDMSANSVQVRIGLQCVIYCRI